MGQTIAQSLIEEGIEIGREASLRATLERLGRRRFGEPSEDCLTKLRAIDQVDRLEALIDRILEATSWQELLDGA